ncbi:MAG: hypothetical protein ACOX4H_05905 [Bacillota bacterium]
MKAHHLPNYVTGERAVKVPARMAEYEEYFSFPRKHCCFSNLKY